MNLNIFACKCFEGSSWLLSNLMCSCMSRKSFRSVDKITLIKLPEDIDKKKIFDPPIIKNNFSIVFSTDKRVISVSYIETFSPLLNISLDKIVGKSIDDLRQIYGANTASLNILEEMIDSSIRHKSFNGIIFDRTNRFQFLVCTYPVQDSNNLYGIYVVKSDYNEGFFSSNLF